LPLLEQEKACQLIPVASEAEAITIASGASLVGKQSACYMEGTGRAAVLAALKLKQSVKHVVAQKWRCSGEAISIENGILVGPDKNKISFSDLAAELAEAGTKLEEAGNFATNDRAGTLSFFAQLAEVEVEAETGRLTIVKITSVNDVGTIINPLVHQAQIDGGVIQGVGYAAMEHLQDADGRIVTANLGDYKIPSMVDIPQLKTVNIHDSMGPGPFANKPIGENTVTPTAAAIANAVYDATGIQIKDLPITSEKIFFALKHGGE
jgi:CO/xanthine dehydrogenase Mo-binding subunit